MGDLHEIRITTVLTDSSDLRLLERDLIDMDHIDHTYKAYGFELSQVAPPGNKLNDMSHPLPYTATPSLNYILFGDPLKESAN
jgi:hypothetical protein